MRAHVVERVGFEPTRDVRRPCGLANRRLEPLGHLSDRECGWPGTLRTCAFSVNSGVLCQLSYWPISNWCTEQVSTLRPPELQALYQLSYRCVESGATYGIRTRDFSLDRRALWPLS
jgi:hypothetical protein